jgi:hypothetical protein
MHPYQSEAFFGTTNTGTDDKLSFTCLLISVVDDDIANVLHGIAVNLSYGCGLAHIYIYRMNSWVNDSKPHKQKILPATAWFRGCDLQNASPILYQHSYIRSDLIATSWSDCGLEIYMLHVINIIVYINSALNNTSSARLSVVWCCDIVHSAAAGRIITINIGDYKNRQRFSFFCLPVTLFGISQLPSQTVVLLFQLNQCKSQVIQVATKDEQIISTHADTALLYQLLCIICMWNTPQHHFSCSDSPRIRYLIHEESLLKSSNLEILLRLVKFRNVWNALTFCIEYSIIGQQIT